MTHTIGESLSISAVEAPLNTREYPGQCITVGQVPLLEAAGVQATYGLPGYELTAMLQVPANMPNDGDQHNLLVMRAVSDEAPRVPGVGCYTTRDLMPVEAAAPGTVAIVAEETLVRMKGLEQLDDDLFHQSIGHGVLSVLHGVTIDPIDPDRHIALGKEYAFGKLLSTNRYVSRLQCVVSLVGERSIMVEDISSTNGTRVIYGAACQ